MLVRGRVVRTWSRPNGVAEMPYLTVSCTAKDENLCNEITFFNTELIL